MPHAILVDNAGGHYMQAGQVDMVIVGTDRVTANGDVANKIGTYLKALAARDNDIPFYGAAILDHRLDPGLGRDIPIEERSPDEVLKMPGRLPRWHRGSRWKSPRRVRAPPIPASTSPGPPGHRLPSPSAAFAPPRLKAYAVFS